MIAATRINAVFFLIFTGAGLGFFLLAAALWEAALAAPIAATLMVVRIHFSNCFLIRADVSINRELALLGSQPPCWAGTC